MRKFSSWGVVAFALAIGAVAATAASPKVTLTEVNREGEPLRAASRSELFLEQDRAGRLIAFVFGEQWPGPCSPTYCSSSYAATYYSITERQTDECGAITYIAPAPRESVRGSLRVIDRRSGKCVWEKPYRWEVQRIEGSQTRYFHGK